MKLYYLTGTCSLASHIALIETGVRFEAIKVDRKNKHGTDGQDLTALNPKGYVPVLQLDSGEVITENVAVLPYIADLNPGAKLAPAAGTLERVRMMEWLGYINSEVHKNFSVLFNPAVPEEMKTIAKQSLHKRLSYIESHLTDDYLLGSQFTVADAYLYVTLSWREKLGVDISDLPKLTAYYERVRARPSVKQARQGEGLKA